MKFRVTCNVKGATFIDGQFQLDVDGLAYTFTPDDAGRLTTIAITAPVADVEKFRSKIVENPRPGVKAHFIHNTDKALFDRLIAAFQRLESHISFSFRLDSVDWQNPKTETICESDEERQIATIFSSEVTRTPRENPVSVSGQEMAKLVAGSVKYDRLTVPMSFYREGMNEYKAQRYITAFFNFYFIVEGLFGRGKTKNLDIERQFKMSKGVQWAVESSLEAMKAGKAALYARLGAELAGVGRALTLEGITKHLVMTRGRLHHFTHSPTRLEGTPFTNPAFEAIAELMRSIATFAIMHCVMEINNGRDPSA